MKRANRFTAEILVSKEIALAHIPHTGRLPELLVPGRKCYLAPARNPLERLTKWTLTLIESGGGTLGCIDTAVPNKLARSLAMDGAIPGFRGWRYLAHEVPFGDSRVDLLLENRRGRKMLMEIKSVTWVVRGCGLFPDAVTIRGVKHLKSLAAAVRRGYEAAMLYMVQRPDATRVRTASFIHQGYLRVARHVRERGVRFHALRCDVNSRFVEALDAVRVELKPPPESVRKQAVKEVRDSLIQACPTALPVQQ